MKKMGRPQREGFGEHLTADEIEYLVEFAEDHRATWPATDRENYKGAVDLLRELRQLRRYSPTVFTIPPKRVPESRLSGLLDRL